MELHGNLDLGLVGTVKNGVTPISDDDMATKGYVDLVAKGIKKRTVAKLATVAPTGGSYNNGIDGVGATLDLSAVDYVSGIPQDSTEYIRSYTSSPISFLRDNVLYREVSENNGITVFNANAFPSRFYKKHVFGAGEYVAIAEDKIAKISYSGAEFVETEMPGKIFLDLVWNNGYYFYLYIQDGIKFGRMSYNTVQLEELNMPAMNTIDAFFAFNNCICIISGDKLHYYDVISSSWSVVTIPHITASSICVNIPQSFLFALSADNSSFIKIDHNFNVATTNFAIPDYAPGNIAYSYDNNLATYISLTNSLGICYLVKVDYNDEVTILADHCSFIGMPYFSNDTLHIMAVTTGQISANLLLLKNITNCFDKIPLLNDQILVKDEDNKRYNGIYAATTVTNSNIVLTRSTEYDDTNSELFDGCFVFIQEGSQFAGAGFIQTTNAPIVIGTTDINWSQFNKVVLMSTESNSGLEITGSSIKISGKTATNRVAMISEITVNLVANVAYTIIHDNRSSFILECYTSTGVKFIPDEVVSIDDVSFTVKSNTSMNDVKLVIVL